MNRSWIKIGVLTMLCVLAASGCKKKPKPGEGVDPSISSTLPTDPNLNPNVNELPQTDLTKSGTNLSKEGGYGVVHFDYDSAVVTRDMEVIQKIAEYMRQNASANITVTGHCDERGSNDYNLSLGERRALSVRAYLVGLGIDGARLSTQSFGEEQPAQPGHDESSWSQNRRAEFIAR